MTSNLDLEALVTSTAVGGPRPEKDPVVPTIRKHRCIQNQQSLTSCEGLVAGAVAIIGLANGQSPKAVLAHFVVEEISA